MNRFCMRWVARCVTTATLAFGVGCDGINYGMQMVSIRVTDASSLRPVPNADVACATMKRPGPMTNQSLSERQYLDRLRTGHGTTDAHGRAQLNVDTFTIHAGPFAGSGLRDEVTDVAYLFGIESVLGSEIFALPVSPGTTHDGQLYSLHVESVSEPRPREPDWAISAQDPSE